MSQRNNFNTSHVNVNLLSLQAGAVLAMISIHLMLMLIGFDLPFIFNSGIFQYISC